MTQDYRRALLMVYKTQVGNCLTQLKNLKGKTDPASNLDRSHQSIILGVNIKHIARIKRENPDITGPRAQQLELAL